MEVYNEKTKTLLSIFIAVVIVFAVLAIPTIATSDVAPDESVVFNITTDNEEYTSGEEIKLNLILENKNQNPIRNIIIDEIKADGFEITDNTADFKLGALGGGETMSATYTFGIVHGDSSILLKILIIVGAVLILGAITAVIVIVVKKKKAKVAVTSLTVVIILPL